MEMVLAEMSRLVGLAGNCGRALTRFIERHFVQTGSSSLFSYPVKVASFGRLHLAMVMAYIKYSLSDPDTGRGMSKLGVDVLLRPDVHGQQVVFCFDIGELPQSVKGRQQRLKALLDAIQLAPVENWVLTDADMQYVEIMLIGELALNKANPSFSIFEDLASGDFSRIDECDYALVCLANELNPDVRAAYRGTFPLELRPMSCDDAEALLDRARPPVPNGGAAAAQSMAALAA